MIQLPQGKARRAGLWFDLVFLFNLAFSISQAGFDEPGWPRQCSSLSNGPAEL